MMDSPSGSRVPYSFIWSKNMAKMIRSTRNVQKKRALVNQRLYFEMNLYAQFRDYFYPQFALKLPANPDLKQKADIQLGYLNTFLDGETYVAGEHLTIADISLLASITTMDVAGMDLDRHPNVIRWYEHCKKIVPGYDENLEGALAYMKFYN
uniref:Glutathione S-transferase 1-1 n=1 Tax=Zeugodacus cucurbitae TaxID=28588 RepID=A0A0A1X0Y3_ZEUCU